MKTITIFLICFSFTLSAQITIQGTVKYDSLPMPSASVIIKNTTKGVATNDEGRFEIEAKKGDTLSFTYLGYKTKDIVIFEDKNLEIQLEEDNVLDEVLILGYSWQTKTGWIRCGMRYTVEVIEETHSQVNPKLFPNPSSNGIYQLFLNDSYNRVDISISNLAGQNMLKQSFQKFGEKFQIDLSKFANGLYIISITADGRQLEAVKAIKG